MARPTDDQTAAAERAAATGLVNRLKQLEVENADLKAFKEQATTDINRLKQLDDSFKDINVKNVLKLVDQMKATQDHIAQMIRLQKGGIYVPGLGEHTQERFSIQRAAKAILNKDWSDAGFEKSVFEESRKAVTKGPGHIVGVDSQGGYFVPDQAIGEVIGAIYAASILISLDGSGVSRMSVLNGLTGIPVTMSKFLGGMVAYWIGEQDRYIESAVRAGNLEMTPKKLGVLTRVTDEMRRFASPGFETLMRADMVRASAALIDYTGAYGTGTNNMPRGVMFTKNIRKYYAETHSDVAPGGSAVGAELSFDDLQNMRGLIEDQNIPINPSFAWVANPRYYRRLAQTRTTYFSGQTTGGGYLLGGPMMDDAAVRNVIGDFAKNVFMPSKNTAGQSFGLTPNNSSDKTYGDVVGGNWSEAIFGRWGGVEMMEDGGVGKGFPTDETYIKMRLYCDIGYRHEESFVAAADAKMR